MLSGKTIWERNINLLRLELVGAFNVDTFRRVLLECVIPWLTKSKASKVTKETWTTTKFLIASPGTYNPT
jgi:hypothetical protein